MPETPTTPAAPPAPPANPTAVAAALAAQNAAGKPAEAAPATPAPKPPEAPRPPGGRDFAALAAQEAKVNAERQKLKAERDAIEKDRAEVEKWKQAQALKAKDPFAWLEAEGLTYDALTERQLARNQPLTPEALPKLVDERIGKLREDLEAKERAREEAAKTQAQKEREALEEQHRAAVERWHGEIREHVTSKADAYPLTNAAGAVDTVAVVADRHFAETGKILTHDEAAKLVEDELTEFVLSKAAAIPTIQAKLKSLLQPAEKAAPADPVAPAPPKTLNNGMGPGTTLPAKPRNSDELLEQILKKHVPAKQ